MKKTELAKIQAILKKQIKPYKVYHPECLEKILLKKVNS